MHRILMRTVVLDFPTDVHDAGRNLLSRSSCRPVSVGVPGTPSTTLSSTRPPRSGSGPQNLNKGASRIHLDVESDDPDAEVGRLVAAGAQIVERIDDWTVLRDPGGLLFCVIPAPSRRRLRRVRPHRRSLSGLRERRPRPDHLDLTDPGVGIEDQMRWRAGAVGLHRLHRAEATVVLAEHLDVTEPAVGDNR